VFESQMQGKPGSKGASIIQKLKSSLQGTEVK
jgi:hypothetical protein